MMRRRGVGPSQKAFPAQCCIPPRSIPVVAGPSVLSFLLELQNFSSLEACCRGFIGRNKHNLGFKMASRLLDYVFVSFFITALLICAIFDYEQVAIDPVVFAANVSGSLPYRCSLLLFTVPHISICSLVFLGCDSPMHTRGRRALPSKPSIGGETPRTLCS